MCSFYKFIEIRYRQCVDDCDESLKLDPKNTKVYKRRA